MSCTLLTPLDSLVQLTHESGASPEYISIASCGVTCHYPSSRCLIPTYTPLPSLFLQVTLISKELNKEHHYKRSLLNPEPRKNCCFQIKRNLYPYISL
ncbi:hypothetical protein E2C01_056771 [Portunus trituberculatus]|uniref:Uncharacterized protein n=1 Tax=Portunus trituberculatus TaxID=210409 RepID=A0A5B7GV24_PORTR|nr:hypothetical protein [Portunus trituberculatus]